MYRYYFFIAALWVLSITMVIIGFTLAGNPFDQKNIKLDQDRVMKIVTLQSTIENMSRDNNRLPTSLTEVKAYASYIDINDPETKAEFNYEVVSKTEFKICTNFSTDSSSNPMPYSYNTFQHKKGYDCAVKNIPNLIPVPTPTPIQTNESIEGNPNQYITTGGTVDSVSTDAYGRKVVAFSISTNTNIRLTVLIDSFTKLTQVRPNNVTLNDLKVGNTVTLKYFQPAPSSALYAREIQITN